MDITYRLEGFEFEWDENKAQRNFEKHGVMFEEAAEVFLDPFYILGDASVNSEERGFVLGYSLAERLLLVVHVERDIRIRIISARVAINTERRLYEQSQ
ncbi:BrnT family toxin [Kovacikia minuta CCNUW1]|uniref:BrnT family toxin n=1 Tax=Kovacikia minuta TaxID=2931930 RepID=UPI001CCE8031|nr:BrnT family toxin [Kovacikia minuta]UBF27908.1 BrnT family toxin [Kovacikia minuta CCNUW1]